MAPLDNGIFVISNVLQKAQTIYDNCSKIMGHFNWHPDCY